MAVGTSGYVDTVARNKKAIAEYIKNQLQEGIVADQISFKEYTGPFTGISVSGLLPFVDTKICGSRAFSCTAFWLYKAITL